MDSVLRTAALPVSLRLPFPSLMEPIRPRTTGPVSPQSKAESPLIPASDTADFPAFLRAFPSLPSPHYHQFSPCCPTCAIIKEMDDHSAAPTTNVYHHFLISFFFPTSPPSHPAGGPLAPGQPWALTDSVSSWRTQLLVLSLPDFFSQRKFSLFFPQPFGPPLRIKFDVFRAISTTFPPRPRPSSPLPTFTFHPPSSTFPRLPLIDTNTLPVFLFPDAPLAIPHVKPAELGRNPPFPRPFLENSPTFPSLPHIVMPLPGPFSMPHKPRLGASVANYAPTLWRKRLSRNTVCRSVPLEVRNSPLS